MSAPTDDPLPTLLPPNPGATAEGSTGYGSPPAPSAPALSPSEEPVLPGLGARSPRVAWPAAACGPDGAPDPSGRARALAAVDRALPAPVDDFDAQGTLLGLSYAAPAGALVLLSRRARAEACQRLGARELLLAWTPEGAARVEDAWAATTKPEALAAWAAARGGDPTLLVLGAEGPRGVWIEGRRWGPSGAEEALPTLVDGGPHPAAGFARALFAALIGVVLALALKFGASG
jgi:hypothetical protein